MASMMDSLIQQMGEQALAGVVADKLGVDERTAQQALRVALPVIIAGLAKNSSDPKGADALHKALQEDHDGSALDNLSGLVGGDGSVGNAILKHVLGSKRAQVEDQVGRQTGLDPSLLAQLLPLRAPLVRACLGRMQKQQQLPQLFIRRLQLPMPRKRIRTIFTRLAHPQSQRPFPQA